MTKIILHIEDFSLIIGFSVFLKPPLPKPGGPPKAVVGLF